MHTFSIFDPDIRYMEKTTQKRCKTDPKPMQRRSLTDEKTIPN